MGDAKRRKLLDPEYGKKRFPLVSFLDEKHQDYQLALKVKEQVYSDKLFVQLVRLDFKDGEYLIGAVHVFLSANNSIKMDAYWVSNRERKNIYRLDSHVVQEISEVSKSEIEKAQCVIYHEK